MKYFVEFGMLGKGFETYEEAELFCGMVGCSCKNIYEVEEGNDTSSLS